MKHPGGPSIAINQRDRNAGRWRRVLPRLLLPVVLAAGPAVAQGQAAQASNYSGASGSTSNCSINHAGDINMQDPNPHTFYYSDLTANVQVHQDWARQNVLDPTSINTTYPGSVSSLTDVVVYDQDYSNFCGRLWHPQPPGVSATVGQVICVSLASGNRCEKHEVRYDLSWWNAVGDDRHRTASCHEQGHAVGLRHPVNENGDSCLVQGFPAAENFTEHDVAHINGGWQSLYSGWSLRNNEQIISKNGRYWARMQHDGNFVLYDTSTSPWAPLWASNTCCEPYATWVVMQGDGNLVIYATDGWGTWALCSTRTFIGGTILRVQDDGNLVLYAPGNKPIWDRSKTCVK